MKKKISCALLAMLLAGQVLGAVAVEAEETKTSSTAVDTTEKNVTVKYTAVERLAPQFAEISGISDEGILTVKKGDKWGFVDITGKTVIDYKYDYASEMVDGIAVVGYKNDSEPYVDKETGESYEYYDLYIIDKTGKETQLFETLEQWYRLDAAYNKTDANGNFILEVSRDDLDDIEVKGGVVYIDKFCFYRYDGTPIYIKDREYLKNNFATFMVENVLGGADTAFLDMNEDGIISVQVYDVTDRSPHILHIDLDGNIVREFPTMAYGNNGFQYTPDEYGVTNASAPENGYAVAYNQHHSAYYKWERNDEVTYTPGYGVMNADGEWVIEPVYASVRVVNDSFVQDGYVTLKNNDGKWGMMDLEGKTVFPFQYDYITYWDGYAILYTDAEDNAGTIYDLNGQAYTYADANGNVLDVVTSYAPTDNNIHPVRTADGKLYLLSGTPDGTMFKAIEGTETMHINGSASSGKYHITKTEAGYGVIEIVVEETEVTPVVEEKVEETKPAEETTKVEEKTEEKTEETTKVEETKSTTSKNFPIRHGSSAAKSKQKAHTSMGMSGLSAMVRH